MLTCSQCGSQKLYRDGVRCLADGSTVQRWLCRDCGFRLTESKVKVDVPGQVFETLDSRKDNHKKRVVPVKLPIEETVDNLPFLSGEDVGSHKLTSVAKGLYVLPYSNSKRQVCESLTRGSKNLSTTTETKTVAGDRILDSKTAKGLLLQYELYLEKEGYGKNSRYISCIRMLINSGADIYDPEKVKEVIAKKPWKDGTKMQVSYAYDAIAKMLKITWTMPTYKQEEILPFIPNVREIDALISGARSHKLVAYLQTLKETYADPTEAVRLKWIDLNENSITINKPVRNHSPRQIPISNQLVAMLKALPRTSEYIFDSNYNKISDSFNNVRRKVAANLQNPRILSITLTTFRHFGATMLYAQTRDILLVKKLLGHKNIANTLKYTQLIQFKGDEYDSATATTLEEAKQLVESGFEYITEINGTKLFRKPKRYVG